MKYDAYFEELYNENLHYIKMVWFIMDLGVFE